MAKNTLRTVREPEALKPKRQSVFRLIETRLRMGVIFENGLPVKYIPYILFTFAIGLFYIGNSHYADKMVRRYDWLKDEVDDMRSEYTTLKADYMYEGMQSEVARKVAGMGLQESAKPPYKIVVKPAGK